MTINIRMKKKKMRGKTQRLLMSVVMFWAMGLILPLVFLVVELKS